MVGRTLLFILFILVLYAETVLRLFEFREKAAAAEKQRVRELQERYEDRMRNCGMKGRIVITYYSRNPGKVICQTASSEECSMVIIGYSGKTLRNQVGSVCKYVFRNAHCPVVIVPSTGGPSGDNEGSSSSPYSSSPRRVIDLPPDYATARRFSLAVPMLRRTSEAGITRAKLRSSCPDISELGDEYGDDTADSKPIHKAVIEAISDKRKVNSQIHETKL